ncbi:MAG: hypothetical protein A2Y10_09135 [Planctomycetes bacterium GWF2_41_51]|nr:MAG: hypothetical protein A2Y10_09135 [Planctomycetes bacterium GWF2_41_51]HBG26705.1 hypothetical protein [Phycisphaerales bacterium]
MKRKMKQSCLFFNGAIAAAILVVSIFLSDGFAHQDGLVAYYSFDNGADVVSLCTDDTGNGHNLLVHQGDPVALSSGAVNGCAVFDGDPDLDLLGSSIYQVNKNHPQLYPSGDFTVSVWVKANVAPSTTQIKWVTRNKNKCGFGIYTNITGVWAAGVSDGVNNVVSGNQRINGTAVVVGKWTHIVLTFKADGGPSGGIYTGTETLYIDGQEISSKIVGYRSRSNDDGDNDDRFGVGYDGVSSSTGYFNGNIDELAIFNFVLAPQDIANLAAKKKIPPQIRRVIAYYSFDNPLDYLNDDSGSFHNLVVHYGAPTPTEAGAVNGALTFDGVDDSIYQVNKNHPKLYPAGDFTLSVWVKTNTAPSTTATSWVTRNRYKCGFGIYTNVTGVWAAGVSDGVSNVSSGLQRINGPSIEVGQWTHIVLTFAASGPADVNGVYHGTETMYVNGVGVGSASVGYRPRSNDDPENTDRFGIGYDSVTTATSYFHGDIDEFAIFAGVLQSYEVLALSRKAVNPLDVLYVEPEPLVAHYSFDDELNLGKDDSGNGLNLIPTYGAPTAMAGVINGAVNFDGDDAFTFNLIEHPEIFPSGDFSVSVWVKADTNPSNLYWISKARYSQTGFGIYANESTVSSGSYQWKIGVADGVESSSADGNFGDLLNIAIGQWTHLACTYKASGPPDAQGVYTGTLITYINGLRFNGKVNIRYNPISTNSADRFAIGNQGSTGGFFIGAIDEFAVFRKALSSTQITLLAEGSSIDDVLEISESISGDINGDGLVNIVDFSILAADWLETAVR